MRDNNTTTSTETQKTPILGAAFRPGEIPLKPTKKPTRLARLVAWLEGIEERPVVCGLIAAAMGALAGWVFGYNI